jgi:aminopeptidase N
VKYLFRYAILAQLFILPFAACQTSKPSVTTTGTKDAQAVAHAPADTALIVIEEEIKRYRAERTQVFDLIHTKLEVSFDWQNQWLLGTATIELAPYFYPQSTLELDARGLEVHQVHLLSGQATRPLSFTNDALKLHIDLDRQYGKDEKLVLEIHYTAKPNELEAGGSKAITSDKGLYFINPLGNEPHKPRQIWTQGETQSNSCWFPTLDAPNQRCTQEMYITVENHFKTLSNGTLIYSKDNGDSTRTDYWKMDLPHAPYLFMMAIGDYAVVEDEWKDVPLSYYVEPVYEPHAKDIFGHTREMMEYFSEILDYPYPWSKYAQVVVRDYVSGAMENTTASVFMEGVQSTRRELIDYDWDYIIAHELFHQWFGDLVTCESWSNLPLNEAFATYGEYLWKVHKYGKDEGDLQLYEELQSYLGEAESKKEDLIRFYYKDEQDMFDNHSYAKGGLILHLLRQELGDDAFFKSLNYYLTEHAYNAVEVHELRLAFEHISGKDLNPFFNQWFLSAGHPELRVSHSYNDSLGLATVSVLQTQNMELYPVYRLPLSIDVWHNGSSRRHQVEVNTKYQEFTFEADSRPDLVVFDPEHHLLGTIDRVGFSAADMALMYRNYPNNMRPRLAAIEYFLENEVENPDLFRTALNDSFWTIRQAALKYFENDTSANFARVQEQVIDLALNDSSSQVRSQALAVLNSISSDRYWQTMESALYDSSYGVAGEALYGYLQSSAPEKEEVIRHFLSESNFNIMATLADYFVQQQDYDRADWFFQKLDSSTGTDLWFMTRLLGLYLLEAPEPLARRGIQALAELAEHQTQYINRLAAYQSLELMADHSGVNDLLKKIKASEKDERLLEYYQN